MKLKSIFSNLKDNTFVSYLLQLVFIMGLSFVLSPCKGKGERPKEVPESARYNRKANVYTAVIDGKEMGWFETGALVSKTEVNEFGIANGKSEKYEYQTGAVIATGEYKMMERTGIWRWSFSDGLPYYEMNFTPGVRKKQFWMSVLEWGNENGPYIRYFENGRVSERGFYDGGNRAGDWVKYYPDTKIESKGSYIADKKVSEWFYYYPDGKKEAYERFTEEGDLEYRVTYYPNGNVWCETKKTSDSVCI
ncbi:hypothetical protein LPTSP3_g08290 [Leptospira kobayashii]|uniref:MORN repeat protein n=1 Tax=Leptospira kobayashii TaxID=1917830 RepID=A0ABN6KAE5_9LEPT|nr:hypothetical protein [Leptospira kobayashii]BDA77899.1 hypothetical protein LPTSP3_g08290 [Leptospira kobayashii]